MPHQMGVLAVFESNIVFLLLDILFAAQQQAAIEEGCINMFDTIPF